MVSGCSKGGMLIQTVYAVLLQRAVEQQSAMISCVADHSLLLLVIVLLCRT